MIREECNEKMNVLRMKRKTIGAMLAMWLINRGWHYRISPSRTIVICSVREQVKHVLFQRSVRRELLKRAKNRKVSSYEKLAELTSKYRFPMDRFPKNRCWLSIKNSGFIVTINKRRIGVGYEIGNFQTKSSLFVSKISWVKCIVISRVLLTFSYSNYSNGN